MPPRGTVDTHKSAVSKSDDPPEGSSLLRAKKLAGDVNAIARLIEEHDTLLEAIEKAPVAFCIYDAADRLLAANEYYALLYPQISAYRDQLRSGAPVNYADLLRYQLAHDVPKDQLEEEVQKRIEAQRTADGTPIIREYVKGSYKKVIKYKLQSGGTAGVALDVSELKHREEELLKAKSAAESATLLAKEALKQETIRKQYARSLSELSEWMQTCKTLEELFRVIRTFLKKMFPDTQGDLFLYSNSRDVLDRACSWGAVETTQNHIKVDDCWGLRRGRIYQFDADHDGLACGHATAFDRPYFCIPILAHGEAIGLLHLEQSQTAEKGQEAVISQREIATQCAEQISLAIANVRLRDELQEQSIRDPLTGLFNRRHFMSKLRDFVAFHATDDLALSVISIDVDRFKQLNDTFGHDAGDAVLCRLGEVMNNAIPPTGTLARIGGEEFSILLPGLNQEVAEELAESLRASVSQMHIIAAGQMLPAVTISCGVTSMSSDSERPSEFLRRADQALYAAKDAGRDRVCSA